MLTIEQVTAIWELLDRAGAIFVERRGTTATIRQSEALEEIVSIVRELASEDERSSWIWTREEILEAWMHQALSLMHAATGRFFDFDPKPAREELIALYNAIAQAEHDFAKQRAGQMIRLDGYVDGVIDLVRKTDVGRRFSREQLFRAWTLKRFVDDCAETDRKEKIEAEARASKPDALLS